MITDKEKLDAPYMPSALLCDIRKRKDGHWSWSNKKALDKIYERDRFIRSESAGHARKEAADMAIAFIDKNYNAFGEWDDVAFDSLRAAILGDSVVKENLITDHIPDAAQKLAIAVKALEYVASKSLPSDVFGGHYSRLQNACAKASDALKEIQG